ncbi:MAG: ATP-binding protein [Deltaproteobacteria bacterium]|nr:ATP-binding protein [Deltaproteobacteria bacterium]MBN2672350.1 ATP-binding protein [Deltaproteobacteria bacterium]
MGKTTLVQHAFPDIPLLRFDSPVERNVYVKMTPAQWISQYPTAILDEIQKAPEVLETLKSCYDQAEHLKYVLLGSSQIMLLQGVRESLAGRVALQKMVALTIPELMSDSAHSTSQSQFMKLIANVSEESVQQFISQIGAAHRQLSSNDASSRQWFEYYLRFGGMPALTHEEMNDASRMEWLRDYHELYLQRDLADLARLADLTLFITAQTIAALRTGQTLQFSSLANAAGIDAKTAKRYLHYLELSYQVHLLRPWFRNEEKRLSKMSKLHFLDPGVRRGIIGRTGNVDGAEFETAVFSELYKQSSIAKAMVDFYHLRTSDGREVDVLIESDAGYIAIECKLSEHFCAKDARHLKNLQSLLDKPLLLAMVVNMDTEVHSFKSVPGIDCPAVSVPAWRLFGTESSKSLQRELF